MSGIKPLPLTEFYRVLHAAGMSVSDLATYARVGRAHLSQVFAGKRSGVHTWKHVIPLLNERCVFHLKQCSAWNSFAEAEWQRVCENKQTKLAS